MTREDIKAAQKAGILDARKAAELEAFFRTNSDVRADAHQAPGTTSSDDESLRFLANFNDIFISFGIVLLTIGLMIGAGTLLAGTGSALIVLGPVLIILWLLLEYFAGRRRLLLPSMTLTVMITFMVTFLVSLLASGLGTADSLAAKFSDNPFESFTTIKNVGLWAAGGAILGAGVIYARFRLPFSLFLIAIAAAFGLYFQASTGGNVGYIYSGGASFIIGLITLCIAILFDARDPERKYLNADNAFWLHLAAAPQIMLGLRALLSGGTYDSLSASEASILLLALAGFSILSLALNRRALIAAGLLSFWLAINAITGPASSGLWDVGIPLLLLGGGIVLLGAGWKTARRIVLSVLPSSGIFARIFPPEPA